MHGVRPESGKDTVCIDDCQLQVSLQVQRSHPCGEVSMYVSKRRAELILTSAAGAGGRTDTSPATYEMPPCSKNGHSTNVLKKFSLLIFEVCR